VAWSQVTRRGRVSVAALARLHSITGWGQLSLTVERPDVLLGGFPCQTFRKPPFRKPHEWDYKVCVDLLDKCGHCRSSALTFAGRCAVAPGR
jgi:hypothetical protein